MNRTRLCVNTAFAFGMLLMIGCGDGKKEIVSADAANFLVYGSTKDTVRDEGVQILKDENQTRIVSTGAFVCQTGSFSLEQVRVAALGQCMAHVSSFLGDDVNESTDGDVTTTFSHASHNIGRLLVDTRSTHASKRLKPSHKVRNESVKTKITNNGESVIVTRMDRVHDSISGDSVVAQINMPSGFSVEKVVELFANSGVKVQVLSEYVEFKGLPPKEIAQVSHDVEEVVPAVKRLLSVKGGICEYKVVLDVRLK